MLEVITLDVVSLVITMGITALLGVLSTTFINIT